MFDLFGMPQKASVTDDLEAEVKCKTKGCNTVKWVRWDERHAGSDPTHANHAAVRCRPCPIGRDFTAFTGRKRWKSPLVTATD